TGASWISAAANLTAYKINSLACNGQNIFAGTVGGGVWARGLTEILATLSNSVWPGDCNYDLTVDNTDFLYLGLAWNDTGSIRVGATINYTAQPATDWVNSFSSGVNHKHADTNGDGVVDANDATAVSL